MCTVMCVNIVRNIPSSCIFFRVCSNLIVLAVIKQQKLLRIPNLRSEMDGEQDEVIKVNTV